MFFFGTTLQVVFFFVWFVNHPQLLLLFDLDFMRRTYHYFIQIIEQLTFMIHSPIPQLLYFLLLFLFWLEDFLFLFFLRLFNHPDVMHTYHYFILTLLASPSS